MSCYCVEEVDLNIFRGVFTEQWLNGQKHDNCQEALFFCTTCGPPVVQDSIKASSNGARRSTHSSSAVQTPDKKSSGKSTFGNTLKKFFTSSKSASKSDLSVMSPKPVSPAPLREHSTRLMSAEEEELPTTPRTEKELYLCVTCGCCYCRDHACDHHYSRRDGPGTGAVDPDAPDKGYPYHSFFIGVPSFVSTHPSHALPETSWGLLFPTVTIAEIERGLIDLSKPVPFYSNFEEICDAGAVCGGSTSHFTGSFAAGSHSFNKGKNSAASSPGHTRVLSTLGSSGYLDNNNNNNNTGSPLLHQKTTSFVSYKDDVPEKTLLAAACDGHRGPLSPPHFHASPPENWSYLMFCAKCGDRQAVRLQGKSCDNEVSRQCHLRRLGQLTAVLAYFFLRGVRLEPTAEFVAYTAQKHAQQVERQRQLQRGYRSAEVQRVGKATEAGASDLQQPQLRPVSTIESSPTLANTNSAAGFGLLSRTETDHVITRAAICGFSNTSYFCYMNSVVQCLLRCRHFTRPLLQLEPGKSPGKLTSSVVHLVRHVSHQTYQDVRNGAVYAYVRALHAQISNVNALFAEDEQQDAQEFLITLLNGVEDEFDKGKTPEQKNETRRVSFEGKLLSEVSCSQCKHRVPRHEMFMSLSIPIEKSIEAGLASLFTTATLTGKDRYACEECFKKLPKKAQEEHNALAAEQAEAEKKAKAEGKKLSAEEKAKRVYANSVYREAEVRTSLSYLGGSLAVHLLRFHYDAEAQDFIKNLSPVRISLTLDLTPYVSKQVVEAYRHMDKVELLMQRFPTASAKLAVKYLTAANNDVKAATQRMLDDGLGVLEPHSRENSSYGHGKSGQSPNFKGDNAFTDEAIGSNMDGGSSMSSSVPVTPITIPSTAKDKTEGNGTSPRKLTAAAICAITREDFDPFGERRAPKASLVRNLVGIVAHRGSLHGGHYIAYVRHATRPHVWFRCDDEDIDVVDEIYVLDHEAEVYLAFYE